jgi:hypothetical protein
LARTAGRSLHLVRVHGRAIRAGVRRARLAIVRQISVIINDNRPHVAITNDFFTIFRLLENGARQRGLSFISDLARIVDTTALLAFRFDNIHAISRDNTFHAIADTGTNLDVPRYA